MSLAAAGRHAKRIIARHVLDFSQQRLSQAEPVRPPTRESPADRFVSITPCSTQDPAGAAALDIEHVDSGDDVPRIEMDLACGVLDLQVRRCGYPQLRLVFADMLDLRWCPDAGQRP